MSIRRNDSVFSETNVRPTDYNTHDYNKGDCTTRAMAYCLEGKMTYNEIEYEQYRLGRVLGTRRNTSGTWDRIMTRNGYGWIYLASKKARAVVAVMLREIDSPIISHSRGHVAVIHKGMVKDTWNSTDGRVDNLLVREEDIGKAVEILGRYGIGCERVDKAKVVVKHHRKRRWGWGW